jgi:hypothetical protein
MTSESTWKELGQIVLALILSLAFIWAVHEFGG